MSIQLPSQLTSCLNLVGIPWPDIDEDQLHNWATQVRTYADNTSDTHDAAHAKVKSLASTTSGDAYDALSAGWESATNTHMKDMVSGCHLFADALDAAADVVVVVKGAIIAALTALAVQIAAAQAAAPLTGGTSEASIPVFVQTAQTTVQGQLANLAQQVIGGLLQAVATPLENTIASAVEGMIFPGIRLGSTTSATTSTATPTTS
ncbi:hypothetical protein KDL01_06745 [Actinospica durhamensis]|uniref:Outer membrane channel protein CpnT-like N-terminal domain-containing protein n=1 Tax=Actinospica durhamensis TaxID=1508375 RepID=A0A941EJY9_9ACTN|nr:hypothetical protein [Actinospica durhamensis]MBR7832952.1 hypothetical protein [Actinospica durhamensis]